MTCKHIQDYISEHFVPNIKSECIDWLAQYTFLTYIVMDSDQPKVIAFCQYFN